MANTNLRPPGITDVDFAYCGRGNFGVTPNFYDMSFFNNPLANIPPSISSLSTTYWGQVVDDVQGFLQINFPLMQNLFLFDSWVLLTYPISALGKSGIEFLRANYIKEKNSVALPNEFMDHYFTLLGEV